MTKYFGQNVSWLDPGFQQETDQLTSAADVNLEGILFDSMVGQGLSGALVVPILARHFKVPFAIVRKPDESRHSDYSVEGMVGEHWLFVDDFIDSGSTRNRVRGAIDALERRWEARTEFVGTYEYRRNRFLPARDKSFWEPDYVG